jgi:hypothetical protein
MYARLRMEEPGSRMNLSMPLEFFATKRRNGLCSWKKTHPSMLRDWECQAVAELWLSHRQGSTFLAHTISTSHLQQLTTPKLLVRLHTHETLPTTNLTMENERGELVDLSVPLNPPHTALSALTRRKTATSHASARQRTALSRPRTTPLCNSP